MDPASLESLRRKYAARGRTVTEAARRQALVVRGARALENRVGAAPGQLVEFGGKVIFLLPGPPRELTAVLEDHVLPWLGERFGAAAAPDEHVFLVTGLGESDIVSRLEAAGFPPAGIDVAYRAAPARVEVCLAGRGEDAETMRGAEGTVRRVLGDHVFAEERVELQDVIGRLLVERHATLAVAESCTGGLLSHRITSVSGSSGYFLGGVVAYSNEAKVRDLQVDRQVLEREGAVSREVAGQMARGARHRFGSDYGVGVTGIAGPTGGSAEKPVGLVYIGVTDGATTEVAEHRFTGDRGAVTEWSTLTALDAIRRLVLGVH
jgi:nicotinamide-nucleotide amidase